ncbi:MAG: primase-helicase family protein [Xanthobacteraceae bacterium]
MSAADATGKVAAAVAAELPDQTDLEIQESQRQAERRAARLGISTNNIERPTAGIPSSLGKTTTDTAGAAAVTAKPVQAERAERSVVAKSVDGHADAGGKINPAKNEVDFLRRVLPWPPPGQRGFCNVHWFTPQHHVGGRPFTSLQDFMGMVEWCKAHPDIAKEIYFCTSLQGEVGPKVGLHHRALRNHKNAVSIKAIFLDVDVKAPPRGYKDVNEAHAAVTEFVGKTGLPPPSALVGSGGGLHVYWISDRPLTIDEWLPYANGLRALAEQHGLLCDLGVTIDCARILRVPGTYNRKTEPGRPVCLLALAPTDINFDTALAHVKIASPVRQISTATPKRLLYNPDEFPPLTPITDNAKMVGEVQSFNENLDPRIVCRDCPMFWNALKTGGKDCDQGLWMMQGLATTFLARGRETFHQLSKDYKTYSPEETDAMFDRKLGEREDKGLGWPSCATFEQYGSKQCKGCKHYGKIKSPLNLAVSPAGLAREENIAPIKEENSHPVVALMKLQEQGAPEAALFAVLNKNYAVVRHGSETLIASVIANEVVLMNGENFHKMFANLRIQKGNRSLEVSRLWFEWPGRRQYLDRGVVFEPGGSLDVADDMLNLWRGFGVKPKQGDWSLLRSHILNVLCSGREDLCDYLLKWMAYAVQRPNEPIGVAVALCGAQGTGKGVVARTFGKIFGKHFAHIANGEQLTGRFNAGFATSCVVFLDEAFWAGEKKAEGVLKALITEPRLQLEAKFRDPIMVDNRLHIIVASNSDWVVPAGIGDRRWFVLYVADTFAGFGHQAYWDALYAEINNGGMEAMFHDLLGMDLTAFNVRAIPHTAGKARQQVLSLNGTASWLHHVLQEGSVGCANWSANGLTIDTSHAYMCYEDFSKKQHNWRPEVKAVWSKSVRTVLGPCIGDTRQQNGTQRIRSFQFKPLSDCRRQFAQHIGAPDLEWEPADDTDETG